MLGLSGRCEVVGHHVWYSDTIAKSRAHVADWCLVCGHMKEEQKDDTEPE